MKYRLNGKKKILVINTQAVELLGYGAVILTKRLGVKINIGSREKGTNVEEEFTE